MAKGIGLIGNFRGKVGNMVGYNLKDSNNKQTQGVRVYQPIVKNPKTYGQAEQRAKLAPINATYRALKMIIDRGQEGKAYGNKSRLAWLSAAMMAFVGGWFVKGAAITAPAIVPLTKGTLQGLPQPNSEHSTVGLYNLVASGTQANTIGAVSTAITTQYPHIQQGDQITFVCIETVDGAIKPTIASIVINNDSTSSLPARLVVDDTDLILNTSDTQIAGAIIVSREGTDGSHLRSTTLIAELENYNQEILADAAKESAIKSYMTGGSNTDWAEESLQG